HVPHLRATTLDHALGGLDVLRQFGIDEPLHHERLEQLEGHELGQAALVQLQRRADHDDRTAGVVDALAEQVLTEAALLALQHVGQRLERTVAGTGHRTAATAVVEQRVDRFLPHALLVGHDDLGRTEIEKARSEEHTSELQSPYDLVCRLLLEKKKKNTQKNKE